MFFFVVHSIELMGTLREGANWTGERDHTQVRKATSDGRNVVEQKQRRVTRVWYIKDHTIGTQPFHVIRVSAITHTTTKPQYLAGISNYCSWVTANTDINFVDNMNVQGLKLEKGTPLCLVTTSVTCT